MGFTNSVGLGGFSRFINSIRGVGFVGRTGGVDQPRPTLRGRQANRAGLTSNPRIFLTSNPRIWYSRARVTR